MVNDVIDISMEFYRRRLPHIVQYERDLFITFKTKRRYRLPPCARNIALARCVYGHGLHYWLEVVVVMPDHVHLILSLPHDREAGLLRHVLKGIKGTSAHAINRLLGRTGSMWQDESFDRVIRRDERERLVDYILENPVRAGLVMSRDDYSWTWRSWQFGEPDRNVWPTLSAR